MKTMLLILVLLMVSGCGREGQIATNGADIVCVGNGHYEHGQFVPSPCTGTFPPKHENSGKPFSWN